jgi:anaerobic magnesium-protoporphyrin IX monomethyl ester cyclase
MKKICIINPPSATLSSGFMAGARIPPVGAAYIAASLSSAGFSTIVIDAIGENLDQFYLIDNIPDIIVQGLKPSEIVDKIPEDVSVIGMSCMFSSEWFMSRMIINLIRERFPLVPIIAGGEHITSDPENSLINCPALDICVLGEGEETAQELCQNLTQGLSLDNVRGICYRDNSVIKKTGSRNRIKNLDSSPWPKWDGIPLQNYLKRGHSMTTINRPSMPVVGSRGCPYRCTFCTSPQMWGTDLNLRSPQEIVREIKYYKDTYHIEHVDFLDIVGFFKKSWVKELLELMIKEDLKISWVHGAGTRSEILNLELLQLFKQSNTLRILYAPETGSETTVKKFKKRINLNEMVHSMKGAISLGIPTRVGLIYGFPDQTLAEVFSNIIFGFKLSFLGVDDVVSHPFSAHPGSEYYSMLEKAGKISVEDLLKENTYHFFLKNQVHCQIGKLSSWSDNVPSWVMPFLQIGVMMLNYLILFIFNPRKILKTLERVFIDKKPLTLADHLLYKIFLVHRTGVRSSPVRYS